MEVHCWEFPLRRHVRTGCVRMYQSVHGYILLIISERYPESLVFLSLLYCVGCGEEVCHKLLIALIHHAPAERSRVLHCHRESLGQLSPHCRPLQRVSSPDDRFTHLFHLFHLTLTQSGRVCVKDHLSKRILPHLHTLEGVQNDVTQNRPGRHTDKQTDRLIVRKY